MFLGLKMPNLSSSGLVQFAPNIPQQNLLNTSPGEFFDVLVGDIISPYTFFVQLVPPTLSYNLDDLIDDMSELYHENTDADLAVPWTDVKVGICCVANIDEKWLRVEVVKVNSITDIQLKLLDFGGVYSAHLLNLKWLLTQFCSLPAQAIPAKLACVAPPHRNCSWPYASGARLLELASDACKSGGLVARLEGIGQGGKLELLLYDTVTNNEISGVDLRKVLIEEGLARTMTEVPEDKNYLEEMLTTNKVYNYEPLRCPEYLTPSKEDLLGTQGSELNEATSTKSQLKSLLNIQNKVHSLVSRNLVNETDDSVFSRMTSLQTEYQGLLAKLLSQKSNTWDKHANVPNQKRRVENPEDLELDDCQYREAASKDTRVSAVTLPTGDLLHVIKWKGHSWVTSAEISSLVPQWRGYDLLNIMLARLKLAHKFECVKLHACKEEGLFQLMIVEEVSGLHNKSGKLMQSVFLFKLSDLMNLLHIFNVSNSIS